MRWTAYEIATIIATVPSHIHTLIAIVIAFVCLAAGGDAWAWRGGNPVFVAREVTAREGCPASNRDDAPPAPFDRDGESGEDLEDDAGDEVSPARAIDWTRRFAAGGKRFNHDARHGCAPIDVHRTPETPPPRA